MESLRDLSGIERRDKEAALNILGRLDMRALADRQINALSGGQQQRLFIARALIQEADILLLDEPFAAVDKATEGVIIKILQALCDEGKTILVVHHDLKTASSYF